MGRTYFVWRPSARHPFRTYRATRRRQPPTGPHTLGVWPTYTQAMRVQQAANAWNGPERRDNHQQQQLLFPDFFGTFAGEPVAADPKPGAEKSGETC